MHVLKAIEEIEKTDLLGKLQFQLFVDAVKTGRNEVKLYTTEDRTGEAYPVHSKLGTGMHPCQHALIQFTFLKTLKEQIAKAELATQSKGNDFDDDVE